MGSETTGKLTPHQKRVIAAMLALERCTSHPWWLRDDIGRVVDAGGFHSCIQTKTMLALSDCGLVLLQVESWPKEVRQSVHCNCAAYRWGLTDAGRKVAETIKIRWGQTSSDRLNTMYAPKCDAGEGQTKDGDRWVSPYANLRNT